MVNALRLAMALFLSAALVSGDGSGQQDFRLKVAVDLVAVDVTILGNPTRELTADDFVLYDGNVPQRITHFSRDRLPLAVALVIDGSGSLYAYFRELQTAARTALRSLKPEDQVVLFGFSVFPTRLSDLTHDAGRLVEKLAGLAPSGSTNIWDAVYVAAHYLRAKAPDHRRAIILISDNGQLIPWGQTGKAALQETLVAGASVFAIRIPGSAAIYAESDTVRMIAENSGGEYLDAESGAALIDALNRSVSKLRMQYTIGFNPARPLNNGVFHSLRVALKPGSACPDCGVHTRMGYYDGRPAFDPGEIKTVPIGARVKAEIYTRIVSAAAEDEDWNEIPFQVAVNPGAAAGRSATKIDVKIDARGIAFRPGYGLHSGMLCIALFSMSADGICFASDWKVMDLQLRDEAYQHMVAAGITYSTSLKGSARAVTAVVYDMTTDKMGIQRLTAK